MEILKIPLSHSDVKFNLGDTSGCIYGPEKVEAHYFQQKNRKVDFVGPGGGFYEAINFHSALAEGSSVWCPAGIPTASHGEELQESIKKLFKQNGDNRVGFLGGDHAITYYTFRAFSEYWGKENVLLISLDAHPDLTKKGGRIPYHSDWLRFLIEGGFVEPSRVIGLGWRDIEPEELRYVKGNNILFWRFGGDLFDFDEWAFKASIDFPETKKFDRLKTYVSVDLDVLSPAFAPGVSTSSCFGLSDIQFLRIIRHLNKYYDIRAFDVTEFNPTRDFNDQTALLALNMIFQFCREL